MSKKIISDQDIFFLENIFHSKKDIFQFVANQNDPKIAQVILESLIERETIDTTGFGNGVAIPHARIKGLETTRLLMIRLQQAMDWQSLDNQPVNLIFCILVPENTADEHVQILGNLANFLMDPSALTLLKNSDKKTDIINLLTTEPRAQKEDLVINKPYYLAVSACTFGLAHTYLVEEQLKQYAQNHDFQIKVETHGNKGDLNIITPEDLEQAKGVILAVDKSLDLTHIKHKNVVRVRTTDVMKNPDQVFEQLKSQRVENKYLAFLRLDLFKHLNSASSSTFNIYFILGALVGISLYITSFPATKNNVFFNTFIDGAQYLGVLATSFLLALFVHKVYPKNHVFTFTIFAISASLTEYNYVVKDHGSYGLLGLVGSFIIVISLMKGFSSLNRMFFFKKEKHSWVRENFYYGFKFLINLAIPLILFTFLFYNYTSLATLNADFYKGIIKVNEYWWFRWIIAFAFILGMAWDSGGFINKWSLMISGFFFYDSFAFDAHQIWMTPITATAMGIIIPCAAVWVRGMLSWKYLETTEQEATKEAGIAVMRSISEGFLYFRKKYGWRTLLAHILTSLVVGAAIGFTNLQFFGGMNNLFSLLFSFSMDDYFIVPNAMYLIILLGGSFVGGAIHTLCYLPNKRIENEKMKNSLYSANALG
ncbi:fructose PTS transporter subunit IIB [Entomoplasma freundtii]|nr:fructose PTS transporter subunit IIB [Entomoplasma freundtii]